MSKYRQANDCEQTAQSSDNAEGIPDDYSPRALCPYLNTHGMSDTLLRTTNPGENLSDESYLDPTNQEAPVSEQSQAPRYFSINELPDWVTAMHVDGNWEEEYEFWMGFSAFPKESANQGASEEKITELKVTKIERNIMQNERYEEEEQCVICQESFETGEEVLQLPCGHIFKMECIKGWLRLKNSCPICQKSI